MQQINSQNYRSNRMAENKYDFWKRMTARCRKDTKALLEKTRQVYHNKYYNLWMNKFQWSGLDEELKEQEENYIMRKFWSEGRLWIRNISNTDMIALCPFSDVEYNYLDFPDSVNLVNERGVSKQVIPAKRQIVNKDGAMLFCTPSQKPIMDIANYYIDRICQAAVLINNNLAVQNMPFIVSVDEDSKTQLEDIVDRVLNNDVAVFTGVKDINQLQCLVTQTPYLVDKLQAYIVSLENELLTILGIDNSGTQAKKAQMLVDEVNANNDVINDYGTSLEDEINKWLDRANAVLNRDIHVESKSKPVDVTSDYEAGNIIESKEEAGQ